MRAGLIPAHFISAVTSRHRSLLTNILLTTIDRDAEGTFYFEGPLFSSGFTPQSFGWFGKVFRHVVGTDDVLLCSEVPLPILTSTPQSHVHTSTTVFM